MFTKQSFIRKLLRDLCWSLFNRIENNNNTVFEKNGEKVFIENLFRKYQKLKGKKILFDIGANVGNYSTILVDLCLLYDIDFELHIFEPQKACFEILSEKFSSNANIILNNFAVSNVNGIAKVYYDTEKKWVSITI